MNSTLFLISCQEIIVRYERSLLDTIFEIVLLLVLCMLIGLLLYAAYQLLTEAKFK